MPGTPRRSDRGRIDRSAPGARAVFRAAVPDRLHGDRGAAVVEAALAIPVLFLVTLAALWGVGVGATQLRVGDAAREAVRVAARGESDTIVRDVAHRSAPDAAVEIRRDGDVATVEVRQRVSGSGPLLSGFGITVVSTAVAAVELAPVDSWEPGAATSPASEPDVAIEPGTAAEDIQPAGPRS